MVTELTPERRMLFTYQFIFFLKTLLLIKLKLITLNVECHRSLCGPLVSTNCTHVHSIITDCRILDMKCSFDDGISSVWEGTIFFGPRHCCVNVFLRRTLEYGGLIQSYGPNGRRYYNLGGGNNIPRLSPEWLQGSRSR